MKCQIPQISWHGRDPVLSVDFQPIQSDQYRLASGGTDSHVLIWYVSYQENNTVKIECASDLYRHNKSVNVVRFSPNGEVLASGDDEGAMFIWQLKEREQVEVSKDDETANKEEWNPMRLLRGHLEDIYDISWSKDGNFLVSASMDNTAILWDMQKFVKLHLFSDFKGYVQGVSWDPCNQFIASLGSDRTLRIHNINSKKAVCRVSKAPWSNSTEKGNIRPRLFYDDTLKSYCRRLTYTPDGELLIVPSGIIEKGENKLKNTCHVFSRHVPSKPVITLPTGDLYTIAVRCNPFLYKLRKEEVVQNEVSDKENEKPKSMINLPYRMIFAVAASDSVLMYDTEQLSPFACISNIHYTHLSDLTWSPDGLILVASSTDGYCSFIVFTRKELGDVYIPPKEPEVEKISENLPTAPDAVLETQIPVASKATILTNAKSPRDVLAPNVTDGSGTPKSSTAVDKKSDKKSPKMASIKTFFVSPKTVVATSVSATKNSKIVTESGTVGDVTQKSEPEVITLQDTPVKVLSSNSLESTKMPEAPVATVTDETEPMDMDENIQSNKDSPVEKECTIEKPAKCKVRLDFSDKDTAEPEIVKVVVKKTPKTTIMNFFSPKSQVAAKVSKTITESPGSAKSTGKVSISASSVEVEKTMIESSITSKPSDKISSPLREEKMVNSSGGSKIVFDSSPNFKCDASKAVITTDEKDNAVVNVDKNVTREIEISLGQNIVISKTENTTSSDAASKIEPVVIIDENASDGDNTRTSISDLKDGKVVDENDWKLELSQDEDIVPMEVVPAVSATKPPETNVTPKRRVAFVTLSSKVTFK